MRADADIALNPEAAMMEEDLAEHVHTVPSSPSDSSPRSHASLEELDEASTNLLTSPDEESTLTFRRMFESYVETNFGRGTRSQTITRETYENYKNIIISDSENSRRRMRLHDQGYRLGTLSAPEVGNGFQGDLLLWRYKSEGRGNNYMSTTTRPRIVAPVEDFYGIITGMHFASPSASGQKKAFKMISKRYVGIPREVVIFYMRNCPHCANVTRRRTIGMGGEPAVKRIRISDDEKEPVKEVEERREEDDDDDDTEPRDDVYVAFTVFVRLLVDKNLNRILPVFDQPRGKIDAIVASTRRQFPEFATRAEMQVARYLRQCRRQRRKPFPAAGPVSLSAPVAVRLLEACRNERATLIRNSADGVESSPIQAITEAEVTSAIYTTDQTDPNPSDVNNFSSFLPSIANMDLSGAAANNLLMASGYNGLAGNMDPNVVLASLSSLPVQPNYLAGALRIVGVLLLMVANQMEATTTNTNSTSVNTNGSASS